MIGKLPTHSVQQHLAQSETYCIAFMMKVLTTRFFIALLPLFIVLANATPLLAQEALTAQVQVVDGCAVRFNLNKPPGVYTIVFRNDNYPLKRISPDTDIYNDGLLLTGGLLLLMAEPEFNRAKLAITQMQDNEPVLTAIEYDDHLLSEQLNTCITNTESSVIPKHNPTSPYAPIPTPAQLRQQAEQLNVELGDYYDCACGEAYSSVTMSNPPWHYDRLVLKKQEDGCVLQSDEPNNPELLSAISLKGTDQMSCSVQVGIRTANNQTNISRIRDTTANRQATQACYNIISAKAQQWFDQGGNISIQDTSTNETATATLAATRLQLNCGTP